MAAQDGLDFLDDSRWGMDEAPAAGTEAAKGPRVYSVYELAHLIRSTLEARFYEVTVEGEVSGYRGPSATGHHYFDLKDETGTLSVALFRGKAQRGLKGPLRTGDQVRVTGTVSVFEKSGRMQILASKVEPAGLGALLQQLEKLKEKMRAEGLFDEERKRPLPFLPRRIGVVTSLTGAVLRDIVKTLRTRNPHFDLLVSPAPMQGASAAPAIIDALRRIDARDDIDVIILARGGGSMEDLWCFNDEALARLLPTLRHPVVSAVGHETDVTLVDFTSDCRVATPTAAAERVMPMLAELGQSVLAVARRLQGALAVRASELRRRLEKASGAKLLRHPQTLVDDLRQRTDFAGHRIEVAMGGRPALAREALNRTGARLGLALRAALPAARGRVTAAGGRLRPAATAQLQAVRAALLRLEGALRLLDPTAVLRRGYTLTRLADGSLLRSPAQAPAGTRLTTQTAEGAVASVVFDKASGGGDPAGANRQSEGEKHGGKGEKSDVRGESGGAGENRGRDGKRPAAARGAAQKVRAGAGTDQGVLFALD